MLRWFLLISLITSALVVSFSSCSKEKILDGSEFKPEFSADTVWFDTLFTTLGSTTKRLKVFNPFNGRMKISSIRLRSGEASSYRLNVDGLPGKSFKDIEIGARDSIYIFAEVTIDPNNDNLPFLVEDELVFETNGNEQSVKLVAYGQNAVFYRANVFPTNGLPPYSVIPCNTVWTNEKPVVIIGYAVVDSDCQLTIEAGTKVHLYNNSGLWVFQNGKLEVNGTLEDSVIFQGVRKESFYQNVAGQWDRIWINQGSNSNKINYAVIKNGFIGLQCENVEAFGAGTEPGKLTITNTKISNFSGLGMYLKDYTIDAGNILISDCKEYLVGIIRGGSYRFRHATLANYWSNDIRQNPSLYFSNVSNASSESSKPLTQCYFGNSIIYGNIQNGEEISFDRDPNVVFDYKFENSLIRVANDFDLSDPNRIVNVVANQDPKFESTFNRNHRLKVESPAINLGSALITNAVAPLPLDITGFDRLQDSAPDAGCFEFKP